MRWQSSRSLGTLRQLIRMRIRKRLLFGLSVAALGLAGCKACTGPPRPNVLLVVIDTLRADRLGAYGSRKNLTPFIDSLAQRGFVFRNAVAQAPWTNPSIASLFTSRYQSQHGVLTFWDALPEGEKTLAEVLTANGFTTGGFNANFLVGSSLGYAQGFDNYQIYSRSTDEPGRRKYFKARGEQINEECLKWLDTLPRDRGGARSPIFLYLQYMEPHNPYDPPSEYIERVLQGRQMPDRDEVNQRMNLATIGEFSDEMVRAVVDYYDAEVVAVDALLKKLWADLEGRGFLDDAVVVITADHGEEFHEHGRMGHDQALYQESIHVPLIVLLPNRSGGVEISAVVSLTDIAPTLLDRLEIPIPPSFEGHSLLGLMEPPHETWQSFFAESPPVERESDDKRFAVSEMIIRERDPARVHERTIVRESGKLIVGAAGEREFFDLRIDPGETNPGSLAPERRVPLSDQLDAFVEGMVKKRPAVAGPTPDPDTLERMRALGYAD